ncbi:MAG: hypothetical protein P1V35_17390, partial [Planctomycetota bacterium]|nr:hypothetical protein [Planctomycetota bacterium]
MTSSLPTLLEISPTNGLDLDEKCAINHFLGKTRIEASELFMENALHYGEDLMWMGEKAFAYYLPALFPYVRSSKSVDDTWVVTGTISILGHRLQYGPSSIELAKESVLWILYYFRDNLERFGPDPQVDRNMPKKLKALIE